MMLAAKPSHLLLAGALCFFAGARCSRTLTELLQKEWSKGFVSLAITAICVALAADFIRRKSARFELSKSSSTETPTFR
ncbi:MAG TPA: hypothetical protein VGG33_06460 [Polyangia bacterium]